MKAKSTVFIKCIICIMLFVFEPITAQQIKIDSLLNLLKTDKEDSSKVDHLIDVARLLQDQNVDTALMLNEQALKLSLKIPYRIGIGRSYHAFIWLFYLNGDQINAIDYGSRALSIWDSLLLTLQKTDKKNSLYTRILGYKRIWLSSLNILKKPYI